MSFEKLLEELDVMTKAMSAEDDKQDDENIQAAADGEGANPDADADQTGDHAEPDGDEDENGEEPMGKSFAFTLEDGTVVEAMDGTEMVKALMTRVESQEGVMAKALGQTLNLVKAQGDMIKSLQDEVKKLGKSGVGRKAVLSVAEKVPAGQTMAKSEGLSKQEFFAKANVAFGAGRITGHELTVIDVSLRDGMAIDQGLITKVIG